MLYLFHCRIYDRSIVILSQNAAHTGFIILIHLSVENVHTYLFANSFFFVAVTPFAANPAVALLH